VLASKYSALAPICKGYLKIIIFWRQRHTKRKSWLKSHLFAMEWPLKLRKSVLAIPS
jgi:hypothetical protein